ncbi:hypothetical protein RhiirC2_714880 [Rhizophagus irregularis]|uniref:Uncharacterized protein n=1 Tax=Rhizophagus irregularis TaxID=588596 RepID=A0A2N1MXK5_9GLOM|nr:hypothetical protein RhiirC2_714880 [Rhizophagus irregularis]
MRARKKKGNQQKKMLQQFKDGLGTDGCIYEFSMAETYKLRRGKGYYKSSWITVQKDVMIQAHCLSHEKGNGSKFAFHLLQMDGHLLFLWAHGIYSTHYMGDITKLAHNEVDDLNYTILQMLRNNSEETQICGIHGYSSKNDKDYLANFACTACTIAHIEVKEAERQVPDSHIEGFHIEVLIFCTLVNVRKELWIFSILFVVCWNRTNWNNVPNH